MAMSEEKKHRIKFWIHQVAIAFDQLLNAIHGGWADETISSRTHRNRFRYPYKVYEKVINLLFWDSNHCFKAYNSERQRAQLPPELRKESDPDGLQER